MPPGQGRAVAASFPARLAPRGRPCRARANATAQPSATVASGCSGAMLMLKPCRAHVRFLPRFGRPSPRGEEGFVWPATDRSSRSGPEARRRASSKPAQRRALACACADPEPQISHRGLCPAHLQPIFHHSRISAAHDITTRCANQPCRSRACARVYARA
jgi:hypothetical protein